MISSMSKLSVLAYQEVQCPAPASKIPRLVVSTQDLIYCAAPKAVTVRLSV